ncbi:NAD(P)-binding protein [Aspergillus ambiguus]|uniref:SDR family oxidoreductase n=1 Tax=Aspergillus ambiguus TaxID=176160 RepID=UPI003CCE0E7B
MTPNPRSTWFITGASSGLGKSLALEALNAGHKVIGATRSIQSAVCAFPEFQAKGGIWVCLDPGNEDACKRMAQVAMEQNIDVLVNNAGYAFIGGVEDTSEDEVRSQMEVNFYGPLRVVRALLPSMREKKAGHIVLISSGASFIARPARGTYSASKVAIEAIHESLSRELESFGVKVLIVAPGAFRTPFASRIITPAQHGTSGFSDAYRGTSVEEMVLGTSNLKEMLPSAKGDPVKAARAIVAAVGNGHDYLRLPLGPDCVAALETKIHTLKKDLEDTKAIATSTNIDS